MADFRTNIAALVRADFTAEADAGFPTVRGIPSTDTVKFLDQFAKLKSAEAAALLEGLSRAHPLQVFPVPCGLPRDSALVQFRNATLTGGLQQRWCCDRRNAWSSGARFT